MSSVHAFESSPYQRELAVDVVSVGEDSGRAFAVLSDTILYPEGGGQPADRGTLQIGPSTVEILDVQRVDGELRHYLKRGVEEGSAADLTLDWPRRYDHMQQHTAQHLLSAVVMTLLDAPTTSFHLGEPVSDIELDIVSIDDGRLVDLEDAVAVEVRAARAVSARRVSAQEYAALEVRSRGLPSGHEGSVRLVEIDGIDVTTCGGTHLQSSAEIEAVKLLGTEPMRGGTRLHWIAGARVRSRLAEHETRAAQLRASLETSDDELVEVVGIKLDQLRSVTRRNRELEKKLAEGAGKELVAAGEAFVERHFDGLGAEFLRQVARHFAASEGPGVALLSATEEGASFFVLVSAGGTGVDIQAAGRQIADILGGRGGGSDALFQGRTGSLAARAQAVQRVKDLARG